MNVSAVRERRLFIALWPSVKVRIAIAKNFESAVGSNEGGAIPSENFHITVAFLGAVSESRVPDVVATLSETKLAATELTLDRIAWWRRHELLCLEPTSVSEALMTSVDRLQAALRSRGFALERRSFRPHVTLARDVRREPAIKVVEALTWPTERFELVESRPSARGSIYTVLGS